MAWSPHGEHLPRRWKTAAICCPARAPSFGRCLRRPAAASRRGPLPRRSLLHFRRRPLAHRRGHRSRYRRLAAGARRRHRIALPAGGGLSPDGRWRPLSSPGTLLPARATYGSSPPTGLRCSGYGRRGLGLRSRPVRCLVPGLAHPVSLDLALGGKAGESTRPRTATLWRWRAGEKGGTTLAASLPTRRPPRAARRRPRPALPRASARGEAVHAPEGADSPAAGPVIVDAAGHLRPFPTPPPHWSSRPP